jgi:uncharacterized protein (DUF2249 family)
MILIEKNIPIPSTRGKYPWGEMEVGDSIFIEGAKTSSRISTLTHSYGLSNKKKFTVRKVDGGVRVWRIE